MVFDERADEEPDDPEFDVTSGEDLLPDDPGDDATNSTSEDSFPEPSPQVEVTFWAVVLLVDVALAGIVLGPVVIYFTGNLALGGGMTAIGLVCAGSAYRRYREFDRTPDEELGIGTTGDEDPPTDTDDVADGSESPADPSDPPRDDSEPTTGTDDPPRDDSEPTTGTDDPPRDDSEPTTGTDDPPHSRDHTD